MRLCTAFFSFTGLTIAVTACSDDSAATNPNAGSRTAGSSSASSTAETTSSTGSQTTSSASSTSQTATGSGGQGGAASTSSTAGSGGSGAAATGAGGTAGGSGAAGSKDGGAAGSPGDAGGDASSRAKFGCPAGVTFPKPTAGQAETVCQNFQYNYGYNEGPTWNPSAAAFFFSNFPQGMAMGGDIVKYTPGGQCEVFVHDVGCNGLGVAPDGNIMAACQQPRAVLEFDVVTKAQSVIANMYMGEMFDSPNDLVASSNGSIYFSNPNYELGARPAGVGPALFWRDPAGNLTLVKTGQANGVTLSADERTLYSVATGAFDLDSTGRPSNNRSLPNLIANSDGIATDCAGNVYSSNGTIMSPQGQSQGTFQGGTNLAFGGADGKTLIVVGPNTTVRTIQMNLPGFP
jgi:gluconolactonase